MMTPREFQTLTDSPLVGVIVSSAEEQEALHPAFEAFQQWNISIEVVVAPAELVPERVGLWAAQAASRGMVTILAVAGNNYFLPLLVASYTSLPVLALQLSPALPAAGISVPILTDASQAALFALRILSSRDEEWNAVFTAHRQGLLQELEQSESPNHPQAQPPGQAPSVRAFEMIIHPPTPEPAAAAPEPQSAPLGMGGIRRRASDFLAWIGEDRRRVMQPSRSEPQPPSSRFDPPQPEAPRPEPSRPESVRPEPARPDPPRFEPSRFEVPRPDPPRPEPAQPPLPRRPYLGRVRVNADYMPVEVVEQAVQCLATGGIVALPTDTVYGLAIDATHVDAARRLYALKERPADKSVAVFIDSQRLLTSVAGGIDADVRNLLEAFWPGPLTVVFEQRNRSFAHLAPGPTIGIRIPDHNVPLTLMQELRHPLACTSANPSGLPEARSADEIEEYFGQSLDLILDAGRLAPGPPSTVIDVTDAPFRITREGAISRAQLAAVLGHLIASQ